MILCPSRASQKEPEGKLKINLFFAFDMQGGSLAGKPGPDLISLPVKIYFVIFIEISDTLTVTTSASFSYLLIKKN